eukprot:TRINITY_DN56522_c0_g1_i2.p1 TRINITY_DN56522_c0_g1~~TRINITY_DN56522_c0_g1_i2.p1  ORF type:complete len:108 (+),score=18.32 TRINITY_DN56522_c0_g1_i2:3-326(+)
MLALAERQGYRYIASLDDDIMMPASSLASFLRVGPDADNAGCGVVGPLLQNGFPTTELFAETFLPHRQLNALYDCFAGSSARWATHLYKDLEPLPNPWDSRAWYSLL